MATIFFHRSTSFNVLLTFFVFHYGIMMKKSYNQLIIELQEKIY